MLTKFQVYERLASEWSNPVLNTGVPLVRGRAGLCLNVIDMRRYVEITDKVKKEIIDEIDLLPNHAPYSLYKFPLTLKGAAQRVKFCQEQMEKHKSCELQLTKNSTVQKNI